MKNKFGAFFKLKKKKNLQLICIKNLKRANIYIYIYKTMKPSSLAIKLNGTWSLCSMFLGVPATTAAQQQHLFGVCPQINVKSNLYVADSLNAASLWGEIRYNSLAQRMTVLIATGAQLPTEVNHSDAKKTAHPNTFVFRKSADKGVVPFRLVTQYEGGFSVKEAFLEGVNVIRDPEERSASTVQLKQAEVIHHIETSFHPDYVGKNLVRKVTFSPGDTPTVLTLSGPLGMLPGNPEGTLLWRRVQ